MIDKLRESAKAVVALVTPLVVALVNDVTVELSKQTTGLVAAALAALAVWLTPNRPAQS